MGVYIKVTPMVASKLGYVEFRNKTADGNYLLWQSDIMSVNGGSLNERIERVGGAKLSPVEAKAETDGRVETPAYCYTPVEYGGEPENSEAGPEAEKPSETEPAADVEPVNEE